MSSVHAGERVHCDVTNMIHCVVNCNDADMKHFTISTRAEDESLMFDLQNKT